MQVFLRLVVVSLLIITLTSSGGERQKPRNLIIFIGDIKGHSGIMAPVFAFGSGASAFSGVQDNAELFHDFMKLPSLKK